MKIIYQAEDGRQFDTEAECLVYERDADLRNLIRANIGSSPFELEDVVKFFTKHFDQISAIVKPVEIKSDDSDGWISNIGNTRAHYPASISYDPEIEVKYRNGERETGIASDWDIVACRIIK